MGGAHRAILAPKNYFVGAPSPDSIANLVGWFKGADFDSTTDNTEVSAWNDYSVAGNNLSAIAGSGDQPRVARNSINSNMTSVRDQSHTGFTSPSYAISNKDIWTIFAVVQFSTGGALFAFDDGNSAGMRMGLSGGIFHLVYPNVADYPTNESISSDVWHVVIVESNGANTATVYVDGVALTWPSQPSSLNNLPAKFQVFRANNNFDGYLAELALYDSAISSGDRSLLNSYASSRFGL